MSSNLWEALSAQEIVRAPKSNISFVGKSLNPGILLEPHVQLREATFDVGKIGAYTYLGGAGSSFRHINAIGRFCAIAGGIRSGDTEHPTDMISTHSMFHFRWDETWPSLHAFYDASPEVFAENVKSAHLQTLKKNERIEIGNDVWIGYGAFIMRGVKIGDGAIIGAKSVIIKDVPPYAIVAGSPARLVRFRFPEDVVSALVEMRWWDYGVDAMQGVDLRDLDKGMARIQRNIADLDPWHPKALRVRLENGEWNVQHGACPALPQPDDVRPGLHAREPRDGVRRP